MTHPNLLHWCLGTNTDQLPSVLGIVPREARHFQMKGESQREKTEKGRGRTSREDILGGSFSSFFFPADCQLDPTHKLLPALARHSHPIFGKGFSLAKKHILKGTAAIHTKACFCKVLKGRERKETQTQRVETDECFILTSVLETFSFHIKIPFPICF